MQRTLHPRNREFEWHAPRGPRRRVTPEQTRSWSERGFFVLEDAFTADEIDAVTAEIDPLEAEMEAYLRTREDGRLFIARAGEITFSAHLVTRSTGVRDFVSGPVFRDLGHDLIGPDVRLYWDQAVYKKPGTRDPFPWHQDNGYTYVEPQQYLTCWVALTDATEDNGCPWVLPGLHAHGTLAHTLGPLGWVCIEDTDAAGIEPIAAPVKKGGIVVLSSLTPHATGPNRTDGVRKAYIVQLAPDGARIFPPGREGERGGEGRGGGEEGTEGGAEVAEGGLGEIGRGMPCNDPERQFPILVHGAAPESAPA